MYIVKNLMDTDKSKKVAEFLKIAKTKSDSSQYQAAILDFDKIVALDPHNNTAYQLRGTAKLRSKQYQAAIQDFNKVLQIEPRNNIAYQLRGEAQRRLGQLQSAIQDFNKALELKPNSATAYRGRGMTQRDLGHYQWAIEDFNKALSLKADCATSYYGRAEANRRLEQYKEAIQDYKKALELEPHNKRTQRALKELKKQAIVSDEPVQTIVGLSATYLIPHSALTFDTDSSNRLVELGTGGFGTVYQGKWQYVNVAIKKLRVATMTETTLNQFSQEVQVMANMTHPNVIRLYGACVEPNHYAMVMEYMPMGSLYNVLHSAQPPAWPIRWKIALDIGKGILHLHTKNILHRDLKSQNILLNTNYQAKVSDFGLSLVKSETQSSANVSNQAVGTIPWMAPELFEDGKYTKPCDIYSYGIILWELASCKRPYFQLTWPSDIPPHVKQGKRQAITADTPPSFATLIAKCWAQRAEQRPNIKEVLQELDEKQHEATISNPKVR